MSKVAPGHAHDIAYHVKKKTMKMTPVIGMLSAFATIRKKLESHMLAT